MHQPYARQYYLQHDATNFEAWAEAVRRVTRRSTRPSALLAVLIRYGAWQASSTECERNFAKTARLRLSQSEDPWVNRELDIIQLQTDRPCAQEADQILARGMKLWVQHAGRPRSTKRTRIDKGVLRVQARNLHNTRLER